MAEAVVSFLLEKLSTLLSQKYTQLQGLEKDIQYIRDELESMLGFLRNAEAKQDYGLLDAEQQAWIKQVREAAYDMEDAVDEFLLHFAHHIHGSAGFHARVRRMYNSVKNLRARHRMSLKIKDIKERVEHIAARHQRYQSTEGIVETNTCNQHPIRGHALLLTEADLVGIDESKREIISLILNDNSHIKAISVVGMGGLGKTTLVKRVYEALDVKNSFSINAWLTISQTLRIEIALKDLIRKNKTKEKGRGTVRKQNKTKEKKRRKENGGREHGRKRERKRKEKERKKRGEKRGFSDSEIGAFGTVAISAERASV